METVVKMAFPINSEDQTFLTERAATIHKSNSQIEELINEQKRMVPFLYTITEELGDNRKFLFEIPFSAVTFHDLNDKAGYEKGAFVNFDVFGIHSIKVYYSEVFKSGTGYGIATQLKIFFVWNQLDKKKSKKEGVHGYYYANFDDKNLCFAETFVFQTEAQYLAFKEIYSELKQLAEGMGLSI